MPILPELLPFSAWHIVSGQHVLKLHREVKERGKHMGTLDILASVY